MGLIFIYVPDITPLLLCRIVAETSVLLLLPERPVEVEGGADQGQMRKRLWEIA